MALPLIGLTISLSGNFTGYNQGMYAWKAPGIAYNMV